MIQRANAGTEGRIVVGQVSMQCHVPGGFTQSKIGGLQHVQTRPAPGEGSQQAQLWQLGVEPVQDIAAHEQVSPPGRARTNEAASRTPAPGSRNE